MPPSEPPEPGGRRETGPGAPWARLEPLLDELLDLSPAEREERLATLAAGDTEVGAEVRRLLAAAEGGATPARSATKIAELLHADDDRPVSRVGERMGPFAITVELGRGGMGAVYAAERVDGGFEQQVAIKVLKRGLDSEELLRRFLAERQILARLEHPHIARLIDGGITGDGLPWFAMERVEGRPITDHADRRGLALGDRLLVFLAVCEAVEAAHGKRIVHRDIKPSNVLVDAQGQVKLLDFGIAKLLEPDGPGLTRTAGAPMTPHYAAPEQLAGATASIATDVWQLGRLLGELLPPAPPRDLARVVALASHDEPERRYQSAAALADDVRRYLDGRAVAARGDSISYRAGRLLRRQPMGVLAAAALALAVAAMAVAVVRSRAAPQRLPLASAFALLSSGGGSQRQPSFSPDGARIAFVADDAQGVAQVWVQRSAGGSPTQLTTGSVPTVRPRWARDGRIVFERHGQGIWAVPASGGEARRLVASGSNPNLSADGRWLVFERRGEGVWLARSDGGGPRRLPAIPEAWNSSWVDRHPALSPDGSEVVYFLPLAGPTGDFWIAPVAGGEPRRLTQDLAEGGSPAWTPDGRGVVVSSSRDGSRTLWLLDPRQQTAGGALAQPLTVGAGDDVWPDVSRDGKRLVYTSAQTAYVINLREPTTGRDREVLARRTLLMTGPSLSPAGDAILFFGGPRAGAVRLFTVRTDGTGLRQVTGGESDHIHPQWSADGKTIFYYEDHPPAWTFSRDGATSGYDPAKKHPSFRAVAVAGGESRAVLDDWVVERQHWTQVDPAGAAVVYTRFDGLSARATLVRDLRTGVERALPRVMRGASWSPDGRFIAGRTPEGEAVRCPREGGKCNELGAARSVVWSADGASLLLGRLGAPLDDPQLSSLEVVAVPAAGGPERRVAVLGPMRNWCRSFSVGPDGAIAWVAYRAGRQELWSARLALPAH